MTSIDHAARSRKQNAQDRTGLHVPSISENALPRFDVLTRGGAEIYRRIRRPVATCNLLAAVAGIDRQEA
jgi:hypothetical protein